MTFFNWELDWFYTTQSKRFEWMKCRSIGTIEDVQVLNFSTVRVPQMAGFFAVCLDTIV
jgi:hypothetical protein